MSAVGVRRDTTEKFVWRDETEEEAERLEVWDGLDEPMLSEPRVECGIWKLKAAPGQHPARMLGLTSKWN